jgi:hypothetical protein
MKNIIKVISILIVFTLSLLGVAAYSYLEQKILSASEVKAKWGDQKVDYKKFKESSYEVKSKMAYSIMTDKTLIGKSYEEIRGLFGENDGYYFSDTIPTYIVQRGKSNLEETWQLVFRMDKKYNVKEIFMHKNCCDK